MWTRMQDEAGKLKEDASQPARQVPVRVGRALLAWPGGFSRVCRQRAKQGTSATCPKDQTCFSACTGSTTAARRAGIAAAATAVVPRRKTTLTRVPASRVPVSNKN